MKKYAERSEAKKKQNRTIKRGPKKLNFGASKPGVRGGAGPLGPPLDPLVLFVDCVWIPAHFDTSRTSRNQVILGHYLNGKIIRIISP